MKVFIVCSLAVLSVLAFARADNVSNDLQQLEGDSVAPDWFDLEPIGQSNDRIRRSPGKNKDKKPKPPKGYPKPPKGSGYPKPPKESGYTKPPKDTNGWGGTILGGPLVINMPPNSQPSYPPYPYPPHHPPYPYPPQSQPPQPQSNPQTNPWPYNG